INGIPQKGDWDGDGIIAQPHQDEKFVKQLLNSGKAVVSLSGPPGKSGLPAVLPNQDAVAELALQHFRDRGFVRFAYCGIPSNRSWPRTREMLKHRAEAEGYTCEIYQPAYNPTARALSLAQLGEWLQSLKRP